MSEEPQPVSEEPPPVSEEPQPVSEEPQPVFDEPMYPFAEQVWVDSPALPRQDDFSPQPVEEPGSPAPESSVDEAGIDAMMREMFDFDAVDREEPESPQDAPDQSGPDVDWATVWEQQFDPYTDPALFDTGMFDWMVGDTFPEHREVEQPQAQAEQPARAEADRLAAEHQARLESRAREAEARARMREEREQRWREAEQARVQAEQLARADADRLAAQLRARLESRQPERAAEAQARLREQQERVAQERARQQALEQRWREAEAEARQRATEAGEQAQEQQRLEQQRPSETAQRPAGTGRQKRAADQAGTGKRKRPAAAGDQAGTGKRTRREYPTAEQRRLAARPLAARPPEPGTVAPGPVGLGPATVQPMLSRPIRSLPTVQDAPSTVHAAGDNQLGPEPQLSDDEKAQLREGARAIVRRAMSEPHEGREGLNIRLTAWVSPSRVAKDRYAALEDLFRAELPRYLDEALDELYPKKDYPNRVTEWPVTYQHVPGDQANNGKWELAVQDGPRETIASYRAKDAFRSQLLGDRLPEIDRRRIEWMAEGFADAAVRAPANRLPRFELGLHLMELPAAYGDANLRLLEPFEKLVTAAVRRRLGQYPAGALKVPAEQVLDRARVFLEESQDHDRHGLVQVKVEPDAAVPSGPAVYARGNNTDPGARALSDVDRAEVVRAAPDIVRQAMKGEYHKYEGLDLRVKITLNRTRWSDDIFRAMKASFERELPGILNAALDELYPAHEYPNRPSQWFVTVTRERGDKTTHGTWELGTGDGRRQTVASYRSRRAYETRFINAGEFSAVARAHIEWMTEGFVDALVQAKPGQQHLPQLKGTAYALRIPGAATDRGLPPLRQVVESALRRRLAQYPADALPEPLEQMLARALAQVTLSARESDMDAEGVVQIGVEGQRPEVGLFGPEVYTDPENPLPRRVEELGVARD
ncbi:hypothetical protein GKO32_37680, partial [Amycolatopsis sp. RM579]|nr:hypothetical protein [Amycolatopsis pithecellobii]